jgi:site-specific DNA recombinase
MTDFDAAGMRLAIYARVSTDEQREGQTIDSQVSELERFAREKAWIVAGVYKDDGWSGAVMARPELDHMRDDARKGLFQAVLINDVDRLARDVAHLGVIKRDLEKSGMRVIFRKLPSETSPTYNLMVNILGSFAEFEREMISDRTRRGRRHKIEVRKQYLGSLSSYGYRYVTIDRASGKEGYLVMEPAEAQVVRQVFEWVDREGLSARRVLNRLNQRGIPAQKGAHWAKSSVLRVLHNEMYAGTWHYNKSRGCEPEHPNAGRPYRRHTNSSRRQCPRKDWLPLELPESLRIVARDQWERVQDRLLRNIAFSPRNEKHFYLLKGLLWCGACGSRYVGEPCKGKFYYRCMARCKRLRTIRDETLNQTVFETVENILDNPALVLEQAEKQSLRVANRVERRQTESANVEAELKQIQTEENRLLAAYRTGILSPAQLGTELETLKARRNSAETRRVQIATVEPLIAPQAARRSVEEYCGEVRRAFRSFKPDQLREFLRTIIHRIDFAGASVRIQGHLPARPPQEVGCVGLAPTDSHGGIATTTIDTHGRNPGGETEEVNFDLTEIIPNAPPRTMSRDARGRFYSPIAVHDSIPSD